MPFGRANRPSSWVTTAFAIMAVATATPLVARSTLRAAEGTGRALGTQAPGVPRVGRRAAARALDLTLPVPYFVGAGHPEDGFRAGDRELARWALEAWQRAIGPSLTLTPDAEDSAVVRLYWASPTGGQYGEMRSLSVGGRLGAAVFIRPDTSSLGPEIAALTTTDPLLRDTIVYLTCLHELGHAFGLQHTDDVRDVMYSFGFGGDVPEYFGRYRRQLRARGDIARTSALSDGDREHLRALYPRP